MDGSNEDTHQQEDVGNTSSKYLPSPASRTRRRWTWLAICGLAVVSLAVVSILMMRSSPDTGSGEGESIGRSTSDYSPGSEAMLYLPGRDSVMVAVDEKALDELVNAISARPDDAQTLIQAGRVIAVPNKTRVRIIEASSAKLKVRILEGDNVMFEVWVPERWIR
jgi:hypothetical protein